MSDLVVGATGIDTASLGWAVLVSDLVVGATGIDTASPGAHPVGQAGEGRRGGTVIIRCST